MADLSTFNPADAGEMGSRIVSEMEGTAGNWWNENAPLMEGYVKALAEAAIQTREALASKRIGEEQAGIIINNQKLAFDQTLRFTKYMTLILAQQLLDAAFSVVGWAIFNKTGINVMPALVKPATPG